MTPGEALAGLVRRAEYALQRLEVPVRTAEDVEHAADALRIALAAWHSRAKLREDAGLVEAVGNIIGLDALAGRVLDAIEAHLFAGTPPGGRRP